MCLIIFAYLNIYSCFIVIIKGLIWFKIYCFLIKFQSFFEIFLFVLIITFILRLFSQIDFFRRLWFRLSFRWLRFRWGYLLLHFFRFKHFLFLFLFLVFRFWFKTFFWHILHKIFKIKVVWHTSLTYYLICFLDLWIILEKL